MAFILSLEVAWDIKIRDKKHMCVSVYLSSFVIKFPKQIGETP